MSISNGLTAELLLAVIFEEFDDAVAVATEGAGFLDAVLSQFNQPMHFFLDGLARAAAWHKAPVDQRAGLREAIEADVTTLTGWAVAAPVNFAQKVAVLEAELLHMDGNHAEARDKYDDAIELSRQHGFLLDEALTYEAAVRYYDRRGLSGPARHYTRDARDAYARWGAMTKVALLEVDNATTLTESTPKLHSQVTRTATLDGTSAGALDLATMLQASEAISGEVVLSRLLRRLVVTVMENAGADRAVMVLSDAGALTVEAVGVAGVEVEVMLGTPARGGGATGYLPESVLNYAVRSGDVVVTDDATTSPRFATDPYVIKNKPRSVMCVPILAQGKLKAVIYLENNQMTAAFTPDRAEVVSMLAGQIAVSIDNARLYTNLEQRVVDRTAQLEQRNQFIRTIFGRYISDDIVDALLESRTALALGGEKRTVTVMFTDLRGFTAMCEILTPEKAVRTLNAYLSVMTEIVQRYNGTIDNLIGDGMIVLFGAPLWREDDAERALACGLEMQRAMAGVNDANRAEGLPQLSMGVGIHTGEVVVGNIGSETRAKYSVIGRNVNIASRVESMTVGGQVFMTEATASQIVSEVDAPNETLVMAKGITTPIRVHNVRGISGRFNIDLGAESDSRTPLSAPLDVVVRLFEGKSVSAGDPVRARLLAVGASTVELSFDVRVADGTDIAIEVGTDLIYAKVQSKDGTTLAHVTSGDVRRLL